MANGNSGRSVSKVSQKIGTSVLIVAAILHMIGLSLDRWATLKFSKSKYERIGLWQHCICVESGKDKGHCQCYSRTEYPAWFKADVAIETLSLLGLVISVIISLESKRSKRVKIFNVFLLFSSGVCIIIGSRIFEVENRKNFESVSAISDILDVKIHGSLDISFALCTVAAGLCVLACFPLFAVNLLTAAPQVQQGPVQFLTLSQITIPTSNQPQVMITTPGMQQGGTRQICAHEQYNAPPSYGPQALSVQTDMQPLLNEGIPSKL